MSDLRDLITNLPKLPRTIRGPRFRPVSTKAVRIRLIEGEYTHSNGTMHPVYELFQHYNVTTNKYQVCSSSWIADPADLTRLERDPNSKCVGCHLMDNGAKHISLRRVFPVTLMVCDTFHLDPDDWKGKPLGFADDGTQKYRKVMCVGDGCDGCKKGLKEDWGRRMYWELPQSYLQTLVSYQDEAADVCANCGSEENDDGEGGLSLAALCCPECGAHIPFDSELQAKLISRTHNVKCESCNKIVSPEEILHCGGCKDPRRPKIFDMDLWIRTTPSKPPSLMVTKFKVKAPDNKIPEVALKSFDLREILRPEPITAQCQLHKVANPWAGKNYSNWEDEQ
jgi:hypothetical protein